MKEVWKDIDGYEGYYQVSNMGRVISFDRKVKCRGNNYRIIPGRTLKAIHYAQYDSVGLWKNRTRKMMRIHRLVATAFMQNSLNKPHINHIDGNKLNNCASNLEWCTSSENNIHAYKTGLRATGEDHPNSKLNSLQVRIIRRLKGEMNYKDISDLFNVSIRTIAGINCGEFRRYGN